MVQSRAHPELKPIILEEHDEVQMSALRDEKGTTPHVSSNRFLFLRPLSGERAGFSNLVRKLLANQRLHEDAALNLLPVQRNKPNVHLKRPQGDVAEGVRRLYRGLYLPGPTGWKAF
ncbi:MAG: hypothetical protein ACUVTG_08450 [Candidatus Oleimicrobiaceae bacterium]